MGSETSAEASASQKVMQSEDRVSLIEPSASSANDNERAVTAADAREILARMSDAGLVSATILDEMDEESIEELEQKQDEEQPSGPAEKAVDRPTDPPPPPPPTTAAVPPEEKLSDEKIVVSESGYVAESESGKADEEDELENAKLAEYFGGSVTARISSEVFELCEEITTIRRFFHAHPELAFEEIETAANITRYLTKLGLKVTEKVGRTGVVGLLEGAQPGPCIMLRADMDALPITETTGLPYASKNEGVMHACGHDCHCAILLGAARVLSQYRDQLYGSVKFIFQPAEEGKGGAKYMIEDGVLENPRVSEVYGLHVASYERLGSVFCHPGVVQAGSERFYIVVKGVSGHAAMPQRGKDSVLIAANLISQLHSIVPRNIDPLEPCVLSVCRVDAGTRFNVIAGTCIIEGTFRTFSDETYHLVSQRIREVCSGIETSFDVEVELSFSDVPYPPVKNEDRAVKKAQSAIAKVVGDGLVCEADPQMVAEDFSFYLRERPGAFFFLGASVANDSKQFGHHKCDFQVDERCLIIGTQIFVTLIFDLLKEKTLTKDELVPEIVPEIEEVKSVEE